MRRKKKFTSKFIKQKQVFMMRCTDPAKEEIFLGNRAVQIENALPLKVVMSSPLGFLKYIRHIH